VDQESVPGDKRPSEGDGANPGDGRESGRSLALSPLFSNSSNVSRVVFEALRFIRFLCCHVLCSRWGCWVSKDHGKKETSRPNELLTNLQGQNDFRASTELTSSCSF
jgi:hypothetical protein